MPCRRSRRHHHRPHPRLRRHLRETWPRLPHGGHPRRCPSKRMSPHLPFPSSRKHLKTRECRRKSHRRRVALLDASVHPNHRSAQAPAGTRTTRSFPMSSPPLESPRTAACTSRDQAVPEESRRRLRRFPLCHGHPESTQERGLTDGRGCRGQIQVPYRKFEIRELMR